MKIIGISLAVTLATVIGASCGGNESMSRTSLASAIGSMVEIEASFGGFSLGTDVWEVVICQVPTETIDPIFAPLDARLGLTSDEIVGELEPVVDYFQRWSHGRYRPQFTATRGVSISADEKSDVCVERALDKADASTRGVLVIANAQHAETAVGGWGRPGSPCVSDCSAKNTRRAVYVGASDFMPFWDGNPPLDLIEHELGHALDWPHSSMSPENFGAGVYDSDIDVMSDSAAPRDVISDLRNAPGPLAINMFLSRWLPDDQVEIMSDSTRRFELTATSADRSTTGTRLVVVPVSTTMVVTIEYIKASGDNEHLDHDRVAVHRVEIVGSSGFERRHTVLEDDEQSGRTWTDGMVQIDVRSRSESNKTSRVEIDIRVDK